MNKLRSRVAGLVLAVTASSAILVPLGVAHASPVSTAATTTKQIAVSTLGQDFRATLTAVRGPSEGGVPTATVRVAVYKWSAGEWKLVGRQTVGESNAWFWNVVTGGHAICRFSTSDVSPYPIEVRLLVSPSIGCSVATYNFHIDKYGFFVAG
jgi:hypothetical protein